MTDAEEIMKLTPEQHLFRACDALAGAKDLPRNDPPAYIASVSSLSTFATAHLLAAQVKMHMDESPYGDPRPWHGERS